MSARHFNLGPGSRPVPGPTFNFKRQSDGKSTGRHTFTVPRGAMGTPAVQALFKKGTPITAIDTTLPPWFSFLEVDETDATDAPGGFTEVVVDLKGYTEDGEFGTDREITYSGQVTLAERSIFECQKYIDQVKNDNLKAHAGISACVAGTAYVKNASSSAPEIRVTQSDELIVVIGDNFNHLKWFRKIVLDGVRTFLAPSYEWTKTTANAGGFGGGIHTPDGEVIDGDLRKLGKLDDPPGNPPMPDFEGRWLYLAASESRSGDSASTERTWSYGLWDEDLYGT